VHQTVEEIGSVMGAGGGLGVVLDGVGGDVQAADPLDHVVVEPDVGDHDPAVTSVAVGSGGLALQRHVEGEAMVLGGDLDLPGLAVQHGLVDAAVAVLELVGGEAQCPAQQLVAQADAEEGQAGIQCPAQQLDLGIGGSRCTLSPRSVMRRGVAPLMPRSSAATVPIGSPSGSSTTGWAMVTSSKKEAPCIGGCSRTRSTSSSSLAVRASPEKTPPRMVPLSRRRRVSMRVSMSAIPTTSSDSSSSSSDCSARQEEWIRLASRTA